MEGACVALCHIVAICRIVTGRPSAILLRVPARSKPARSRHPAEAVRVTVHRLTSNADGRGARHRQAEDWMLTKSGLRLGMGLPQGVVGGRADTRLTRAFATRAEQLGYADLWLTDNLLGGRPHLEPVTLLAYAAACTERIRLGVSVIILNQRNPVPLAKALASLDQLSGGRLTVGVGLGSGTADYAALGISDERPVARFIEGLRVMRALWSQERVDLDGRLFHLRDVAMAPKPLQSHLPVWIGAHVPAALRRAVRLGDGWMGAGSARNEDFIAQIGEVRRALAELGRDEAGFTLSKRIYVAVDADEGRARAELAATLTSAYGVARDGVGVAGTAEQCSEALRWMRDAGLHHLLLQPCGDVMQQLEVLTTEVAPAL
jgi:probable F420-dependent oxidoreductase